MSSTTPTTGGYVSTGGLTNYGGTTAPGSQPVTITGLTSGINTTALINALMAQRALAQQQLQTELASDKVALAAWQGLSQDATQLQQAADALSTTSSWNQWAATSSSPEVTATAGAGAVGGALTFSVDQLATAASLVSSTSVASTASTVTTPGTTLLVATGGAGVGLSSISGTLANGPHTITVTQASAAATATGTALPASTTAAAGDSLSVTVDGTAYTLSLAGGTGLSPAQLAAQVSAAAQAAGAPLQAAVDQQGRLVLETTSQGSSQSLQITGGSALAELGLSTGPATSGTDAVVSVDGTATTLTTLAAGQQVTLAGPGGASVSATLATGGLSAGTVQAAGVSTGDGTLGAVVGALNGSGLGLTASAVQTGPGAYRLQVSSTTTGSAASVDLPPGSFSGLGALQTLSAGADAKLTVGSGPAAFQVTSASNTVTTLLPGVSIQLQSASPGTPVTVSLSADAATAAAGVSTLVGAANAMIKDLSLATATSGFSTPTSQTSGSGSSTSQTGPGPLLGDPVAESVLAAVQSAFSGATGATGATAGSLGLSINQDGTVAFDQAKFTAAFNADPHGSVSAFTQHGSATSSQVSFYEASDSTTAGTYTVDITQAASQATATGAALGQGATLGGPETISVRTSGATFSYSATAGQTLAQVAAGLNAAGGASGVQATVTSGGALQLHSAAYGSGATFSVSSTASGPGSTGIAATPGTWQSYAGTDVAGTINGTAGTGTGQLLIGALNTPEQGLLLQISTTPAQLSAGGGSLGTVTYSPGIAQGLATAAMHAVDPSTGSFTTTINGLNSQTGDLQSQIAAWNPILAEQQAQLVSQFTAMETALATLRSTLTSLFPTSSSSGSGAG